MDAVLLAERAAAAAIDAGQAEAARVVAQARLDARAQVERAEAVAQAIHARTESVAARRATALVAAAGTGAEASRPLAAVVDELAAWLVSGADG